ncbi:type VI secretion system-associated FHA domain protein [Pseudomonas aeruginosa]
MQALDGTVQMPRTRRPERDRPAQPEAGARADYARIDVKPGRTGAGARPGGSAGTVESPASGSRRSLLAAFRRGPGEWTSKASTALRAKRWRSTPPVCCGAVHRRLAAETCGLTRRTEERTAPVAGHVARYRQNPLRFSADAQQALGHLLRDGKPGRLSGEQAVARSFRDLRRTRWRCSAPAGGGARDPRRHFSPQRLALRFERDGRRPLLATSKPAGVPTVATTSRAMPGRRLERASVGA